MPIRSVMLTFALFSMVVLPSLAVAEAKKGPIDEQLKKTDRKDRGLWLFVFDPLPAPPPVNGFMIGEPLMLVDLSPSIRQVNVLKRYVVPTVTRNADGHLMKTDVPHYRVRVVLKEPGRKHLVAAKTLQEASDKGGILTRRRAWLYLADSHLENLEDLEIPDGKNGNHIHLGLSQAQLLHVLNLLDEEKSSQN